METGVFQSLAISMVKGETGCSYGTAHDALKAHEWQIVDAILAVEFDLYGDEPYDPEFPPRRRKQLETW